MADEVEITDSLQDAEVFREMSESKSRAWSIQKRKHAQSFLDQFVRRVSSLLLIRTSGYSQSLE